MFSENIKNTIEFGMPCLKFLEISGKKFVLLFFYFNNNFIKNFKKMLINTIEKCTNEVKLLRNKKIFFCCHLINRKNTKIKSIKKFQTSITNYIS